MMFWSQVAADISQMKHDISAIKRALNIENTALQSMEKLIMATLDDVLALAAQQTTLEASVKTGIDGLNAHVADLQAQLTAALSAPTLDQAKIDQLSDALTASNAALSAMTAVQVNTPAAAPAQG